MMTAAATTMTKMMTVDLLALLAPALALPPAPGSTEAMAMLIWETPDAALLWLEAAKGN